MNTAGELLWKEMLNSFIKGLFPIGYHISTSASSVQAYFQPSNLHWPGHGSLQKVLFNLPVFFFTLLRIKPEITHLKCLYAALHLHLILYIKQINHKSLHPFFSSYFGPREIDPGDHYPCRPKFPVIVVCPRGFWFGV